MSTRVVPDSMPRPPVVQPHMPRAYPRPPMAFPPPPQLRVRKASMVPLVVAALGVLIAGVVGLAATGVRMAIPGTSASVGGPSAWSASSPGCAVDANGDGVLDHVGLAGSPGNTDTITLVNGNDGSVIWSGDSYADQSRVHCLDRRWFFVSQPNFQVHFFDVRNRGAPVRVMARDQVQEYGMGQNCASIKTQDGSLTGIALPAGTATECKAELRRIYDDEPGELGLTDYVTMLSVGKRNYVLRKRQQGTAVLSVSVNDDGKELWSKELPYASPTFSSGIAVAGKRIMIWGAEISDRNKAVLIGLDESNGNQLYAKPVPGTVSSSLNTIYFNGRYLLTQYWVGLRAFDPETGSEAWSVGH